MVLHEELLAVKMLGWWCVLRLASRVWSMDVWRETPKKSPLLAAVLLLDVEGVETGTAHLFVLEAAAVAAGCGSESTSRS